MKSIRFSSRSIPLAIFLLSFLSYGLLIPWTGFYWDDWPFAWIARFLGPSEFISAFRGFRPFLGLIFAATTSLIPPNPLLWQILALLIRFSAGLSAWWAFGQIWPDHKRQTLTGALLFLVFPGYSQHWVAFTHINQEWIPFIFYILSFGFSARALRNPNKFIPNTLLALALLIAGVFPTEYFIALEPLRFLFIWFLLAQEQSSFWPHFWQTFKRWLPYLLIWLLNAAWLAYYYKSGAYISYDLAAAQSPAALTIGQLLISLSDALWKAGLYIWLQILVLISRSITAPATLATLGLILISFALLTFYLRKLELSESDSPHAWALQAILIGFSGILLGRLPSWAAGLPLTLQSSYDRFMISMMLGGSLFAAGLIELPFNKGRIKVYALAMLVALGVGQQFFNANIFRRDWTRQQEIYWQFAWRIPALQPGTALLTQQMPLDYETDLSMTAPLNWIYAPDFQPPNLPYALLYTEKRLGGTALPDLKPGTAIQIPYRTVTFHGSTSQALVIYVPPNGCLRVLDPVYANAEVYEKQSHFLTNPIPLSDPSRIIADAPSPVLSNPPFSREPSHTWCYLYEKAELARQIGDWGTVTSLGREAEKEGYAPDDVFEWLPFIEAYARTGDVRRAETLSRAAYQRDTRIRKGLCQAWQRVDAQAGLKEAAAGMLSEFGCGG